MTNAADWKFGMSTTGDFNEDTFRDYAENGVEYMEVSPCQESFGTLDFKQILTFSQTYGVTLWSFHLPFAPFETNDISSCDKTIRKNSVELRSELIRRAADIGIERFIIHPSGEPIADEERPERLKRSQESLFALAELASRCGGTLCVEDLPRTCLGHTIEEIKLLSSVHENLRVCFDTNHLLTDSNIDFVRALRDKIVTLHVSDYDFTDERHWIPYEGKTDWVALIGALEEVRYSGPLLYEVSLATPPSIVRERPLTRHDFFENYKALTEKRPFVPFGKPNPAFFRN